MTVESQVVTYQAGSGQAVAFEILPLEGFEPAGVGEVMGRVRDAVEPAVIAAQEVLDRIRRLGPDRVEVKFGIKVSGRADWVVARAATEGNFEVTLAWGPNQACDPAAEVAQS
jgi:hypothetical protein